VADIHHGEDDGAPEALGFAEVLQETRHDRMMSF
jgi:hypothetical protein